MGERQGIAQKGVCAVEVGVQPEIAKMQPAMAKVLQKPVFLFPAVSRSVLEAQQRYFSYRAIPVTIVSRGIAQMCLCETKCQGGVSHRFGGVLTSVKKYRSDSIAISRDMGPLRDQCAHPFVRRIVLGSLHGPCYQRDLPMQGIICDFVLFLISFVVFCNCFLIVS